MEEEANPLDEFDDLYVQDGIVEIGRHRFSVRHLQVVHSAVAFRAFRVACAMLGNDAESEAMLAAHGEDILPAITAATDIPLDKLRKMRGGVQMRLWAAVLQVNEDFFVQYADQIAGGTAERVQRIAASTAGPALSTTSSPEGMPTAKRTPLADLNAPSARPN